jgi:hypothetical protein
MECCSRLAFVRSCLFSGPCNLMVGTFCFNGSYESLRAQSDWALFS